MSWSYPDNVPPSMKYFKPSIQKKAIAISNHVLANGADEGKAIAIGISKAKSVHNKKASLVKLAFIVPGAFIGFGLGAIAGSKTGKIKNKNGKNTRQRNTKIGAWTGAAIGATAGAYGKIKLLEAIKNSRSKQYNYSMPKPPTKSSDIQKFFKEYGGDYSKIKTKLDAKKVYRDAARKHHPDAGGNPEMFKKLSTDWENVESSKWFTKLAALTHRSEFVQKILKAIKKGDQQYLVSKYENLIGVSDKEGSK